MATRRQFLTTATAGVSAALLPTRAAAIEPPPESVRSAEDAERLRKELKRYVTMVGVAQAGPQI